MAPGFNAFYDPLTGRLRGSVNKDTNQFSGFMDRLANEFRAGVAFVVAYYGIDDFAWDNLVIITKNYTDSGNNSIENLAPFDGGGFQMFWPLLRTNEEKYVEILPSLRNFLYSHGDFAQRNNIPGFLSASSIPEDNPAGAYSGKIGLIPIAETTTHPINIDIGSVYSLAAAYSIDPTFVLAWLDSIRDQYPNLTGAYGFFDSFRSASEVSPRYYAIDQASIILGLADTGADDFDVFMANRGLADDFTGLYERLNINVTPYQGGLPAPPTIPERTYSVFTHFSNEGTVGTFPFNSLTDIAGAVFNYAGQTNKGGRYWILDSVQDVRGRELVVSYSLVTSPQEIIIELLQGNNVRQSFTVPTTGTGIQTAILQVATTNGLASIDRIKILVDPGQTGVQTANFRVHRVTFRQFPTNPVIQSDSGLNANDLTFLPSTPTPILTGGSNPPSTKTQLSGEKVNLQYDVTTGYAGLTLNYDDFGTPGIETEDLSSLAQLIVGLSAPNNSQVKVEFEDISGFRDFVTLADVDSSTEYYAIDLEKDLSPALDLTKIRFINFIVDGSLVSIPTGTVQLRVKGMGTEGILSPDPSLGSSQVTSFPNNPQAVLTGGSTPASSITQPGSNLIDLNYNVQNPGEFAGITLTYDDPITAFPQIETQNLSSLGKIIVGLNGAAGTKVQMEVVDGDNNRSVLLLDLGSANFTEVFFQIDLYMLSGVDLTQIQYINFVVSHDQTPAKTGTLRLRTKGFQF
jgi:hypothetical protein